MYHFIFSTSQETSVYINGILGALRLCLYSVMAVHVKGIENILQAQVNIYYSVYRDRMKQVT